MYTQVLTLRSPRVAVSAVLLVAVSVWGFTKMTLSSSLDDSAASVLRYTQSDSVVDTPQVELANTDGTFEKEHEYISKITHVSHGFNAIGFKISEHTPTDTHIDFFVRAAADHKWTDWIEVQRDYDGFFSEDTGKFTELIPLSTSYDFQYKALLHTDNTSLTPKLETVETIYINSGGYIINVLSPEKVGWISQVFADSPLHIITRQAWGADESLRVKNDTRLAPQLVKIADDILEQFATENPIVKRVRYNDQGQGLTWPLEYPATVNKIIIHHTGKIAPKTPEESVSYLRAVYYYHAITRGWGDIGYNYVIDAFGNVYEGRYGGDGVVGAHAGLHNRGSIGISLMGDFDAEHVSPAQIRSLEQLITALTKRFGIDPRGTSVFRGKDIPNIVGHEDVMSTSCPGGELYALLPAIRQDIGGIGDVTVDKLLTEPDFVKNLNAQRNTAPALQLSLQDEQVNVSAAQPAAAGVSPNVSEKFKAVSVASNPGSVTLEPNELRDLTFQLDNTGDVEWNDRTYLDPQFAYPGLTIGGDAKIRMNEPLVKPGERATFTVPIQGSIGDRVYSLSFHLVVNGFEQVPQFEVPLHVNIAPDTRDLQNDESEKLLETEAARAVPNDAFGAVKTGSTGVSEKSVSDIRIKLDMSAPEMVMSGNGPYLVMVDGQAVAQVARGEVSRVTYDTTENTVVVTNTVYKSTDAVRFVPIGDTILQVVNFERRLPWHPEINDNQFRGIIEVRTRGTVLGVINELSLEDYLKGIGEVSEADTHPEKKKAMAVVARTYALYYMTQAQKFPGEPYNLDDLASNSQKYLGYGFEVRSPKWVAAVAATRGEVVEYKGVLVKTPYFSQSDGRTHSALETWGWTDTPYLQSVPDPLCTDKQLLGHGVGLSGCGAEAAARNGHSYKEILKYYYKGITVGKVY